MNKIKRKATLIFLNDQLDLAGIPLRAVSFIYICGMFRKLREYYRQYKDYVRVDLIMYGVMILLIILYFIYSVLF